MTCAMLNTSSYFPSDKSQELDVLQCFSPHIDIWNIVKGFRISVAKTLSAFTEWFKLNLEP